MGSETGSYGQSGSSGGQLHSAKGLYESRKSYGRNVGTMGDVSEYRVEHLTTLTMDRKDAVLTVADSIRKLKILEARGKIWSQELMMMVDDEAIRLIDYETTETLEHFPISHLQDVQPILNASSYQSICALVVRESHQVPPDIYLFQCSIVPADIICADISSAMLDVKNKKSYKRRSDTLRKYRDVIDSARQLPNNRPMNMRSKGAEWNVKANDEFNYMSHPDFRPENSMEMMVFKIHRDVDMLNHSLDDIEYFVSLLQKSAAASEELSKRENKKKSNQYKERTPGMGITEVRARLPPKEQFVDIFQKFKLSFNLLAKLRDHIKDPNAVELVHYLFQPLAMIVHTCCGFELPRTVKSPLFQRQTIAFLRNCTSTKEMELLERLGDFWIKSRGEFGKEMYFPPYVPRFLSGWEPPPIPEVEVDTRAMAAARLHQAEKARRKEERWRAKGARIEEVLEPISPPPNPEPSRKKQAEVKRNPSVESGPKTRKLCRVIHDYNSRSEKELTVRIDELLEVLNDSKNWWKVRNNDGDIGYVPEMVVLLVTSSSNPPTPKRDPSPPNTPPVFVPTATTTPKFTPSANLPAPNAAKVLPNTSKVIPSPPPSPVTPVAPPAPVAIYSEVKKKKPPVSTPTRPAIPTRSAVPVSATLQEELSHRVSGKNQRNFVIPKKKASSDFVTIDRSSTAFEVQQWLVSLEFSPATIASLGVLTGGQIFSMTRDEVKETCGDEGSRVFSQLMIQRNMDGYATTTEKSELKEVLKRIRESIPDEAAIAEE